MTYPDSEHGADEESQRDYQAEFEAFLLQHDVHVALEESFHLSTLLEDTSEVRQHNHVVIRSLRTNRMISLCVTSMNWDDARPSASVILMTLAGEASMFEMSEHSFLPWATSFEFDPDSRAAERKFNQTAKMCEALFELLGERAYAQLLQLSKDFAEFQSALEGDSYDDDGDDDDE